MGIWELVLNNEGEFIFNPYIEQQVAFLAKRSLGKAGEENADVKNL